MSRDSNQDSGPENIIKLILGAGSDANSLTLRGKKKGETSRLEDLPREIEDYQSKVPDWILFAIRKKGLNFEEAEQVVGDTLSEAERLYQRKPGKRSFESYASMKIARAISLYRKISDDRESDESNMESK